MLDDEILEKYINGFYGYGNFEAPFWFIGMEEGGGNSIGEINKRVSVWKEMGSHPLADLADYHQKIGLTQFFGQKAKLQKTWSKLIRVVFGIHQSEPDNERIREYQNRLLGRKDRETCLMELLPLPAPNTTDWLYGRYSRIQYLRDRESYRSSVIGLRVRFIRQKITEFNPNVVLFYGSTYKDIWLRIADGNLSSSRDKGGVGWVSNGRTQFVFTKHPASKGITNEYFDEVGRQISKRIDV